jgi:putative inorganic carbon (HCO3(-)) transporter
MTEAVARHAVPDRSWFKETTAARDPEPITKTPLSYWLLIAFLVLLYANTPFILPAADIVHPAAVVGGGALLALLAETLFGGRSFVSAWPEGGILLAFLVGAALSCLTALWPGHAVDALSDLAKMSLVFFFLVNAGRTDRLVRGVMWTMVAGGLFPAIGTLHNFHAGNLQEGRAAWVGIFANPNEVAYSLVILLPFAAYLALRSGWLARMFLAGASVLYLLATFVTFSRGGLVGIAVVAGVFVWKTFGLGMRFLLLAVLAFGLIFAGRYWSRGEDFSHLDNDVSFQQRIATSQAGWGMFMDHPLTGVGLGCSVIAWPLYAPEGLYTRGALVTHNTIIQVFGETGLLGAIPFLLFLAFGIWRARRVAQVPEACGIGVALEAALWGLVACGMSGGYVLTWFPYLLMGLTAAAYRMTVEPVEESL